MKRSYENALKLLETRRRKARPKTPAIPSSELQDAANSNDTQTVRGIPCLVGMQEWLRRLGHADRDIDNLNIIHVSGTKGKGSTCAFTRSFLRVHGLRTGFPKRIGLYTSPNLQCIRERIQIDDRPISEDLFTQYFFEVWESLMSLDVRKSAESTRQPRYLQFLALLAFHAFIREDVDAAIFETHHGGEYDATNVIQAPVVTGITSLGMDHIAHLGPTIENIAWHKAGIFKTGAPAFSVRQEVGPAEVLRNRAAEKKTNLTFVSTNMSLPVNVNVKVLSVPVQRLNCSLALELAKSFLQQKAPDHTLDSGDISAGVDNFFWAGRFELLEDGASQWFLDGAHNTLSLPQAAKWFAENTSSTEPRKCRVLIFSHFSNERDGVTLVHCLAHALSKYDAMPDHVIFTTYQERDDGSTRIDKTLQMPETPFPDFCAIYSSLWKRIDPQATVSTEPSIEGAIRLARNITAERCGVQVLVTGDLPLVGGARNILQP